MKFFKNHLNTKGRHLIILSLGLILMSCGYKNYSLYGKLSDDNHINKSVNIAFDRFGDMYPDIPIDNAELENNQAALSLHFGNSSSFRNQLYKSYSTSNLKFDSIEKLIVKWKADEINNLLSTAKYSSIVRRQTNLDFS